MFKYILLFCFLLVSSKLASGSPISSDEDDANKAMTVPSKLHGIPSSPEQRLPDYNVDYYPLHAGQLPATCIKRIVMVSARHCYSAGSLVETIVLQNFCDPTEGRKGIFKWLQLNVTVFITSVSEPSYHEAKLIDVPELKWYKQYYVDVEKYSVLAGIVEEFKVWYTKLRSRADYNGGVTKKIIYGPKVSHTFYGVKYSIHPETTEDGGDKTACLKLPFGRDDKENPFDVLPDAFFFEKVGDDYLHNHTCVKFEYKETSQSQDIRETLWARYDKTQKIWIPLRYVKIAYNVEVGSMTTHDIVDYYNFKIRFSRSKTFYSYVKECDEESVSTIYDMNDEAVTKHLHSIDPENEEHVDHVFTAFKNKYNREYSDDANEHALRRKVFQENMRLIAATNRQNLGYKLAVNQFTDRTPEERKRMTGLKRRPPGEGGTDAFPYTNEFIENAEASLPTEYDARDDDLVSPVKNQLDCGSCWSFGTTTAAEGAVSRSVGRLMRLSNQALIDCSWAYGNSGCDGGFDVRAYRWMMDYGLPTEEEYGTYEEVENVCRLANVTKMYPIRGFVDVTPKSIGALKYALVNHGPLSVSIDASEKVSAYSSGILYDTECSETSLTHEVAVVGYGERYGDTFWIIKNSWGQEWGIGGYMLISAKNNNCGVMTEPTYVLM